MRPSPPCARFSLPRVRRIVGNLGPLSRKLAIVSLAFAWLCANGVLWDAMQIFAWGKMLAGYTETMSLGAALRETFDPAKPCEMCVGIAKAKDATHKQAPAPESSAAAKFHLAMHPVEAPVFATPRTAWPVSRTMILLERTDPVPLPPPRA